MTHRMVLLAGACAAVIAALPAAAQRWDDREWRQIRVDASALDLATDAGIDELAHRISKAVNRICGSDRECADGAWASTEDQVADAIDRDRWMRRLAEERLAQLEACRWQRCAPRRPAYYPAPHIEPQPMLAGGVTVTIIYTAPQPVSTTVWVR